MKILINSVGSLGDLNPFLSLGMALQKRGHNVKVLTTAAFQEHVKEGGLPFIEVVSTAQYDKWRTLPTDTNKGEEDMKSFNYLALPAALPSAKAILDNCTQGCVAIGMPLQTLGIQFAKLKEPNKIHTLEAALAARDWEVESKDSMTFSDSYGPYFKAISNQVGNTKTISNWYNWFREFDQKLTFYPNWFTHTPRSILSGPSSSDFVFYEKDDEADLPADLIQFIEQGSPPIAFTFGSYVSTRNDLFQLATDVCQKLGTRAVFLTKYVKQLPNPLPPHVFHGNYVSLKKLLPKMSLFVHHGGIGTLAQALRAGKPHLTCPMAYDQFDNAKTLEYLNVGKTIKMDDINPDNLYHTIKTLITDSTFKDNAKILAAHRFNSDGAEKLCEQIERMYY